MPPGHSHLYHAANVPGLGVEDVEEDGAGHLGLVLQFDHLGHPVGLLRVVEGDALALQTWDGRLLPPGGGVAAAPQEHVIGGGGGALGP